MLYLQTLKSMLHLEYITTFLVEVFFVNILVDPSSASSVPEYTDTCSCSESSETSLSEAEEEKETARMENFRQQ